MFFTKKLIKLLKITLIVTLINLFILFVKFKETKVKQCNITYALDSNQTKIFNEIFTASNEQLSIEKSILLQTISFMIQETDELDPKLIEFVSSIIRKTPSKDKQLNLKNKERTDFSQIGQSKFIDQALKSRRNGFFIEAGGYNGEDHSVNNFNFFLALLRIISIHFIKKEYFVF